MTHRLDERRAIDQMDAALDMLLTCETALYADNLVDEKVIVSVRGTIEQAMKLLTPVREQVNNAP